MAKIKVACFFLGHGVCIRVRMSALVLGMGTQVVTQVPNKYSSFCQAHFFPIRKEIFRQGKI